MNKTKRSSANVSPWRLLAALSLAGLAAQSPAETIATINGVEIDSSTFDLYLESRIQKPANQATPAERDAVFRELKDIYLLTTQPKARQVETDPRVKAQIELGYRGALAQAVAADYFANNPATEEEIVGEYETQISMAPTEQFKARHILVETQGAATDLIEQLNDGGDFASLAKEHSTGPSGPGGGDLGWFSPEQMVKPFADAVAELEDGSYTPTPVQTEFGWHVILREDSRENEPPTLESVRDVIKQRVEQQRFQRYIEGLRESAGG